MSGRYGIGNTDSKKDRMKVVSILAIIASEVDIVEFVCFFAIFYQSTTYCLFGLMKLRNTESIEPIL